MRKICIINQKGGVGKTTTTVNLGVGLAREGKRVLIVDLDPQGNITTCLKAESKKDLYDLLVENAAVGECTSHVMDNLDIIKSKETLTKAELILVGETNREMVLRRKLDHIKNYDYILLDCPPSLGLLNQNAMLFATEAIIPTSTDILGVDGLNKMVLALQQINEVFDHSIMITKIVPTMHDARNRVCIESLKKIQSEYYQVVSDPIRINAKLKEAPSEQLSIFDYDNSSRGATDYKNLVKMVVRDEAKYDQPAARASSRIAIKEAMV
ncbi:ParA family protein [Candidatus Woesearchaeota archaeon]|nr:ParA family protein [Candidatus Woesearchaeota archaeon]